MENEGKARMEKKRKPIKRVAVIHDICGIGKAALTNILPILSVMGVEPCPVLSYALSTHTGGFGTPAVRAMPDFIAACGDHYRQQQIQFDVILVGYLGSLEAITATESFINQLGKAAVILDPVFGDYGKYYQNFDSNYEKNLKRLISCTDVLTPNYTEACLLTGIEYKEEYSESKLEKIAEGLFLLGAKSFVITSVPAKNDTHIGICVGMERSFLYTEYKRTGKSFPGTGDIFTAVLTGYLMRGEGLENSSRKAHSFVENCILVSSGFDYPAREGVLLERCLGQLME